MALAAQVSADGHRLGDALLEVGCRGLALGAASGGPSCDEGGGDQMAHDPRLGR